jgi:hypothetical protein
MIVSRIKQEKQETARINGSKLKTAFAILLPLYRQKENTTLKPTKRRFDRDKTQLCKRQNDALNNVNVNLNH